MKHLPVIIAVMVAALAFGPPAKQAGTGPVSVAMAKASRADKAKLRDIYKALADKTQADNGTLISTLGMWRQLHINTLKLAASEMRGKYDGLDVAVEKVLSDHVPLEDVAMPGVVNKVVAGCREVAAQSE